MMRTKRYSCECWLCARGNDEEDEEEEIKRNYATLCEPFCHSRATHTQYVITIII